MRVALFLLLVGGCITPPAVSSAGSDRIFLDLFPPGSTEVVLPVTEDVALRGVFVPAEAGAPVIVHLLGSGGSVATSYAGVMCWSMRDRGYASLAVDYEGVGASGGDRSPNHLHRDARVIWDEAVRRAGAPERVILRGTSLGSLATASLLEDGVQPAAVTLFSPVRGETVARNWMIKQWWDVFAYVVSPFVTSTTDANLVATLASCTVPLIVFVPGNDVFLPPDEMKLVEDAVREAKGTYVQKKEQGHLGLAIRAFGPLDEEFALYDTLFPGRPPIDARLAEVIGALPRDVAPEFAEDTPARAELAKAVRRRRFVPPTLSAALVLEGQDGEKLLRWLRTARPRQLPFEAQRALVDFDDPAGALDPRELYGMRNLVNEAKPAPERLVAIAREKRVDRSATLVEPTPEGFGATLGVVSRTFHGPSAEAPARLKLSPEESYRQGVRLLLKAFGFAERMRDGRLEVWENGKWRPLPLE